MVFPREWAEMHQIFYPCNKFDTPDKLSLLEPFYFSLSKKPGEKNGNKGDKGDQGNQGDKKTRQPPTPKLVNAVSPNGSIYTPYRKNSLFWCVYIKTQGLSAYYAIPQQKLATTELTEQIKIAEFIETSNKRIEKPRITKKFIQELRSDLMVMQSRETEENPLRFLVAYALYYDVTITVWVKPHLYLEIGPCDAAAAASVAEEGNSEIVIYRDVRNGTFGVQTASSRLKGENENPKQNSVRMESWDRALRPATYYKVEEIADMLEKLKVVVPADCKKKCDLYTLLQSHCAYNS